MKQRLLFYLFLFVLGLTLAQAQGITISGKILRDANGLVDNTVNGTGWAGYTAIMVNLEFSTPTQSSTTSQYINADGSYIFSGLSKGISCTLYITYASNDYAVDGTPVSVISTGEHIGIGPGNDGNADGRIQLTNLNSNIVDANFGLNTRPTSNNVSTAIQINPLGTTQIQVPTLTGFDQEDGSYNGVSVSNTVQINTLPTNGTLYYNSVPVIQHQTIINYDPIKLTVDPTTDGSITVQFTYSEFDASGISSLTPATVTMPFSGVVVPTTGLSISGTIYNDANGLTDYIVNGTPLSYVYAHVFDPVSEIVIASMKIPATSTYSFTGLTPNTTYKVAVSVQYPIVGSPRPSNTENLINAVYTGEGITPEGDGTPDGITSVSLGTQDLSGVNFSIDFLPRAFIASSSQINPGNATQVQVPTLTGDDPEDGLYNGISGTNTIMINSLPNTGTLYYQSVPVIIGDIIHNYNPTQLTLDPPNGSVTVKFTYREMDAAGQSSAPAEVTISFSAPLPIISGRVFNDANGLTDNTVNGVALNNKPPLYVVAIYPNIRTGFTSAKVAADGTYSISVQANTSYTVQLVDSLSLLFSHGDRSLLGLSSIKPTGENIGSGTGSDGTPDAKIKVDVSSNDVIDVNFGVNNWPNTYDAVLTSQPNPLGTIQVQVPTLTGSDPEDGIFNGVSGTNTVAIYFNFQNYQYLPYYPDHSWGTLYYNGIPVTNGQIISNYNPTRLTVDPVDGNVTVGFYYKEVDASGAQSYSLGKVLMPFTDATSQIDFGDAPNIYKTGTGFDYSTNAFTNGARHTIVTGLQLGPLIDSEGDGSISVNADGDNLSGQNDEDGVVSFAPIPGGNIPQTVNSYNVSLNVINTTPNMAYLSGWIDWNNDGTFANAERVQTTVPPGTSSPILLTWTNQTLTGPRGITNTYARFRLSTDATAVSNSTGAAPDGEVEDYRIPFAAALPVELTRFEGKWIEGTGNQLIWGTAWEQNSDRFEIQSSRDIKGFETIGRVAGQGTTATGQSYSFVDVQPQADFTYYRLKQVDKDGTFTYSRIIAIKRLTDPTNDNLIAYPNPVTDQLNLRLSNQLTLNEVSVYSISGQQVLSQIVSGSSVNVKSLPSGIYVVEIKTNEGKLLRQRFIKQ